MASVDEKLAESLTARSTELIPYLPYLLQDLWELGSSPSTIVELLRRHASGTGPLRVLDLACGKGAVSVALARSLGCRVDGVDLLEDFLVEARRKAAEHGVAHLCRFEAADANRVVERERGRDVVVFGAAGDILGSHEATLAKLAACVRPGGLVVIDDAFLREDTGGVRFPHEYRTRSQWLAPLPRHGLELVEAVEFAEDAGARDRDTEVIARRAGELAALHPGKKALFEGYVASQRDECDDLARCLVCVTLVLRKGA